MACTINKYLLCIFSYFIISLIATCYRVYCGRCFFVSKNSWGEYTMPLQKLLYKNDRRYHRHLLWWYQIGYLKLKTCSKRLLAAGSFNIYISYISRKSKQADFTFLICYLQMIHFDNSRFRSIYMLAAKVTHIAKASIYQLQHINIVKAIVDIISPQTS